MDFAGAGGPTDVEPVEGAAGLNGNGDGDRDGGTNGTRQAHGSTWRKGGDNKKRPRSVTDLEFPDMPGATYTHTEEMDEDGDEEDVEEQRTARR